MKPTTLPGGLSAGFGNSAASLLPWLPVILGLLAIALPSIVSLSQTTWGAEENGHGPIILLVVAWLVWGKRQAFSEAPRTAPGTGTRALGWIGLVTGLLAYVIGRSQSIDTLEVAALLPVLAGVVVLMRGWPALRTLWFPFLFMLFLIPLPGIIVDAVTGALKQNVSAVVENALYAMGYPIARSGVVINIGQYQLLVADACSGLNSMFSLSALGLLYLHVMRYTSWLHIGVMLLAILPIAFAANVVRVMALVLITYYFGDEAGQGFAHSLAGMLLFVVALAMLFGLDRGLSWIFTRFRRTA